MSARVSERQRQDRGNEALDRSVLVAPYVVNSVRANDGFIVVLLVIVVI
jgi:hypothetical protein